MTTKKGTMREEKMIWIIVETQNMPDYFLMLFHGQGEERNGI